ncbi:MAG: NAD-dependent epimerase/dehydratase family protein [Segetibacter sp.]
MTSYTINYTYLDFTNVASIEKELNQNKYDFIIHAAGTTKAKNQKEYNQVNASYTINLATAAAKAGTGLQKMIFVSSLAALGPLNQTDELITENTVPAPVTAYGKSKLLAEQQLKRH